MSFEMLSSNRAEGTDSSSLLQLRDGVFVSLTSDEWCIRRDGGEKRGGQRKSKEQEWKEKQWVKSEGSVLT